MTCSTSALVAWPGLSPAPSKEAQPAATSSKGKTAIARSVVTPVRATIFMAARSASGARDLQALQRDAAHEALLTKDVAVHVALQRGGRDVLPGPRVDDHDVGIGADLPAF